MCQIFRRDIEAQVVGKDKCILKIKDSLFENNKNLKSMLTDQFNAIFNNQYQGWELNYTNSQSFLSNLSSLSIQLPTLSKQLNPIQTRLCYKFNNEFKTINYQQQQLQQLAQKLHIRLSSKKKLNSYQLQFVIKGIKKKGRIGLADQFGLGKTIQAFSLAYFYQNQFPLLILTNQTQLIFWKHQIMSFYQIKNDLIYISKQGQIPKNRYIVIGCNNFQQLLIYDWKVLILDQIQIKEQYYANIIRCKRLINIMKLFPNNLQNLFTHFHILRPDVFFQFQEFLFLNTYQYKQNKIIFYDQLKFYTNQLIIKRRAYEIYQEIQINLNKLIWLNQNQFIQKLNNKQFQQLSLQQFLQISTKSLHKKIDALIKYVKKIDKCVIVCNNNSINFFKQKLQGSDKSIFYIKKQTTQQIYNESIKTFTKVINYNKQKNAIIISDYSLKIDQLKIDHILYAQISNDKQEFQKIHKKQCKIHHFILQNSDFQKYLLKDKQIEINQFYQMKQFQQGQCKQSQLNLIIDNKQTIIMNQKINLISINQNQEEQLQDIYDLDQKYDKLELKQLKQLKQHKKIEQNENDIPFIIRPNKIQLIDDQQSQKEKNKTESQITSSKYQITNKQGLQIFLNQKDLISLEMQSKKKKESKKGIKLKKKLVKQKQDPIQLYISISKGDTYTRKIIN